MTITRRGILATAAATTALAGRSAQAQPAKIRIGVLSDMSGHYRDTAGPTSALAAKQAVEDMNLAARGIDVEVLSADHQQKADVGAAIARQWFDQEGVDVVMDVNNSAIAFAVNNVAREKDKVVILSGAASSDLTGKACGPNHIHWAPDTWADAHAVGAPILRAGGKKWFCITADYTFGKQLQADITSVVKDNGGIVVGSALFPFPGTTDFSAQLVQARTSGAEVVGLCMAGGDTENCVKQAAEFGLAAAGIQVAALTGFITNVHAVGLETARGLSIAESFYWDLNDRTRAFTKRLIVKSPDNWPSCLHAGAYSGVTHYLRVVAELGVAGAKSSGRGAIEAMKRMPTDDDAQGRGSVRADGRRLCDMYLLKAKAPGESHGPWDLLTVTETIPGERAFRPMADGACPMVKV